ncbi:2OG-Fe(II) oxygenase superfamily protein [compost metagenome]
MISELSQKNWSSSSEVFSLEFTRELVQECHRLSSAGAFTKAAIGRGTTKGIHTEIRGDYTYWIYENEASPLEKQFLSVLQEVQDQLNRELYLGLQRVETHYALYPPQSGYQQHVDNPHGAGHRRITFVLYLNENWQEEHGGKLTLFNPEQDSEVLIQIAPCVGTFVLFCSDVFPHQVETSYAPRMSLTGWFRNDAL